MNKYKVCVYAICKNEEQFIDRWMDAVSEADMVVVTDTGSEDNTVEKLRNRGAIVHTEKISPWRFDVARNIALEHVPEDVDICVANDLDEVFEAGWRQKLEDAWQPHYTRARYLFTWSFNADGTPSKQFPMEKAHRRHGFKWKHPVHEILEYSGEDGEKVVLVPGMVLNHYPDLSKPRTQYLSLLEMSAEENPQDDRTMFWLGREYMYNNKHDQCIRTLERHLSLPSANWPEERSASMRFIAKSYQQKNNFEEAQKWYFSAIAECPYVREPYLYMAKLAYLQGNWPLVYFMTEKGLAIEKNTGSYLNEIESWGSAFYDLGAIATYHLGLYEKAQDYAQKACDIEPHDPRLTNNLEFILKKMKEEGASSR